MAAPVSRREKDPLPERVHGSARAGCQGSTAPFICCLCFSIVVFSYVYVTESSYLDETSLCISWWVGGSLPPAGLELVGSLLGVVGVVC